MPIKIVGETQAKESTSSSVFKSHSRIKRSSQVISLLPLYRTQVARWWWPSRLYTVPPFLHLCWTYMAFKTWSFQNLGPLGWAVLSLRERQQAKPIWDQKILFHGLASATLRIEELTRERAHRDMTSKKQKICDNNSLPKLSKEAHLSQTTKQKSECGSLIPFTSQDYLEFCLAFFCVDSSASLPEEDDRLNGLLLFLFLFRSEASFRVDSDPDLLSPMLNSRCSKLAIVWLTLCCKTSMADLISLTSLAMFSKPASICNVNTCYHHVCKT